MVKDWKKYYKEGMSNRDVYRAMRHALEFHIDKTNPEKYHNYDDQSEYDTLEDMNNSGYFDAYEPFDLDFLKKLMGKDITFREAVKMIDDLYKEKGE